MYGELNIYGLQYWTVIQIGVWKSNDVYWSIPTCLFSSSVMQSFQFDTIVIAKLNVNIFKVL